MFFLRPATILLALTDAMGYRVKLYIGNPRSDGQPCLFTIINRLLTSMTCTYAKMIFHPKQVLIIASNW